MVARGWLTGTLEGGRGNGWRNPRRSASRCRRRRMPSCSRRRRKTASTEPPPRRSSCRPPWQGASAAWYRSGRQSLGRAVEPRLPIRRYPVTRTPDALRRQASCRLPVLRKALKWCSFPQTGSCGRAQVGTLRLRLLKLGAWIESSVRRIVIHLPIGVPFGDDWRRIARTLGAVVT